jgi:D-alanyl-D-alanine carboxypeptidase/D-alanyl-D-alanine-endopeptidase (penicillin-binding protein 4)
MMVRFVSLLLLLASCSPVSRTVLTRTFRDVERELQDHTGFMLYDPATKKEVFSYQAEAYYTPASNTKIFTLYTALTILGDSIPGLRYRQTTDSLIIAGTGDPSFLYPLAYSNSRVFDFLADADRDIYLTALPEQLEPFGPGWAWDDYYYIFSSERSAFPVYGNYYHIRQTPHGYLQVVPDYFQSQVWLRDSTLAASRMIRAVGNNQTDFFPGKQRNGREWKIPFRTSQLLTAELLSDTLHKPVRMIASSDMLPNTLFSVPADSLYKVMMQESDNFIAEQLLAMSAGVLTDTLNPTLAINYMLKTHLTDLPDQPRWVDGSGLSRYNLFTPRSVVRLWEKLYEKVPRERLFPLLAIGGKTGTVKNYYKHDPPYLYGKTGTVSNNHSLSGFLITRSGKTLIFSYMSNNYVAPTAQVRGHMERILKLIYEKY